MTVRIDDRQTCHFDIPNGLKEYPASELTIITDSEKAMSAVDLDDGRIYITEAEADALTVAGAADGRQNLKATDSGSVI
ncbi:MULTISPECIES: DUF3203 family protein [Pseudomonas]|uniref:DUF3203 family protein n=1 Tax=Pseudomonas TaxID=286 RepID=UPI001BE911AE|nr:MULTISPECIES: DUF3203 family protein [Pseudomonas]MBT2339365.1 DUF3203 family protein [Pseudomonas fluorescens]MCD4530953.1 DUF3203 family protein [Pseudomonas sp. C3-2018]